METKDVLSALFVETLPDDYVIRKAKLERKRKKAPNYFYK
jgi:hypothetical protein